MRFKGLDHVVLQARDIQAMLGFYRDVLGCPVERTLDSIGLYQLRAGAHLIDLFDAAGEPAPASRNMDHFCLQVANWDEAAIRDHLARHGIKVGPAEPRYGAEGSGQSMYIEDPEGNVVELKGPAEP